MRILLPFALAGALLATAQTKPAPKAAPKPAKAEPAPDPQELESSELERALGEAGGSPVEYVRVLEAHLKKYPNSTRRAELERVLSQAAVELKDKRRAILYGVPALEAGNRNPLLLDHVSRALLDKDDKDSAEKALKYSSALANLLSTQRDTQIASKDPGPLRGRRLDETEYALARAYTFQARANGNLGKFDDALAAAAKGWEICPSAENAYERARWGERGGKSQLALDAFAEALVLADDRSATPDPAKDRARLAELAKKATGAENGFGDALLAAFDRVAQRKTAREARLRAYDPNYAARNPLEFTLSAPEGAPLALSSLKGKVVVIDFWATWCGPCRAQHPLYEQAKARFADRQDVVFLAISTDEDRDAVAPFLAAQKWPTRNVYYEDGMASVLRISSIPTTVVLDREGAVLSRMQGFLPDRFVDMLTDRIREALAN